ncbi:MAG TPA: uroporphyrinogen-III synthase [Bacteroidales bacterium]|nr:uroporphyrinogen-III synthase [Bacteroidales bacterium]HRS18465.1 uroporphyrinogen-III synthase [Bacteroidales bacterium]
MTNSVLHNTRILLTGAAETSQELAEILSLYGATVKASPMIEIKKIEITDTILKLFGSLSQFQWVVFTSKYGVSTFFDSITPKHIPQHIQWACVGKKTAQKLTDYGYIPHFICSKNNGKDFAQEFSNYINGQFVSVFFPTGNLTENMITLSVSPNISITKCIIYNTVMPSTIDTNIFTQIEHKQFDYIIFTSPSGVTNCMKASNNLPIWNYCTIISIGPSTSKRLQKYGCTSFIQAEEYNSQGIISVLQQLNSN